MKRVLLRTLGVLLFALGAAYALGGAEMWRSVRARIRAFMEPPTPAQIQRAVAVEAQQARADSITRADTTQHGHADPPASAAFILGVVGATLAGTLLLLILSTRWAGDQRGR